MLAVLIWANSGEYQYFLVQYLGFHLWFCWYRTCDFSTVILFIENIELAEKLSTTEFDFINI